MKKERHVSETRATLVAVAERRLEEIGWKLNGRTLNASRFAGTCTMMVYFDTKRRGDVGLISPVSRSRVVSPKVLDGIAEMMSEAHRTVTGARRIVDDLYRWIHVDHLEAMAVIGGERDRAV